MTRMPVMIYVLLVVALIGQQTSSKVVKEQSASSATRLLNQLLEGYDNRKTPNAKGPTVIKADLNIRSMGPISEVDMTHSMDTYFRQTWQDDRLRFKGVAEMAVHIKMLQKIWKPDTYIVNGLGSYLHTITEPNKLLRINPNGTVLYSMRLTIKASCPMYLQYFPVDEQSCPLQFGSYAYTEEQVRYEWKFGNKESIKTTKDMRLSQFDLIGTTAWHVTEQTSHGRYSTLKATFRLRRHMGYFLIQVYVPCILIVVLSWVSFWLNREATADRVGLGITTVLTLTTTSMDTRDDLPKVYYATALDWFVIMCFGFVIGSLLQFAAVHYFTKIGSGEFEAAAEQDSDLDDWVDDGEGWCTDDGGADEDGRNDVDAVGADGVEAWKRNRTLNAKQTDGQRSRTPSGERNQQTLATVAIKSPLNDESPRRHQSRDSWLIRLVRCLQGNERYRRMMRRTASPTGVNSVSMIDKVSRVLFPAAFFLLNCIYWIGYTHKNSEPNTEIRLQQ